MKIRFFIAFFSIGLGYGFAQIPTDNLVLYLPFNGNANDASGNSLNGVNDGAIFTEDRGDNSNSAVDFDGFDDAVVIPHDPMLDLEFPFSVSIWFYRDVEADDIQMLFKSDADDDTYSGYWINMAATGHVVAAYGNGTGFGAGARVSKKSTDPLTIGEWHHVIGVFNGLNDTDLYIDCVLDPGTYSGTAESMSYLGKDAKMGRYDWRIFDGKLDDLRIYSDALTAEEINALCQETPRNENLDIIENTQSVEFEIYPNPTSNVINVQLKGEPRNQYDYKIEIVDAIGKVIFTTQTTNSSYRIDLISLGIANGLYNINVLNNDRELKGSKKFILAQ